GSRLAVPAADAGRLLATVLPAGDPRPGPAVAPAGCPFRRPAVAPATRPLLRRGPLRLIGPRSLRAPVPGRFLVRHGRGDRHRLRNGDLRGRTAAMTGERAVQVPLAGVAVVHDAGRLGSGHGLFLSLPVHLSYRRPFPARPIDTLAARPYCHARISHVCRNIERPKGQRPCASPGSAPMWSERPGGI